MPIYGVWESLVVSPEDDLDEVLAATSTPCEARAVFNTVEEALLQLAQSETEGWYRALRVEEGGDYDADTRVFVGGTKLAGRTEMKPFLAVAKEHTALVQAGKPSVNTHARALHARGVKHAQVVPE